MATLASIWPQLFREWEDLEFYAAKDINAFVDRWEGVFLTFGLFVKGTRVRPVSTGELQNHYHHTPDGMRGILSLNMAMFRAKTATQP
jgi:hypothetical protein